MHHGSDISVQTVEAASKSSFPTISTSLMAASTFQGRGGESLLQFFKPNFTALDFIVVFQYLTCLLPDWNQDKSGVLLQCNMREVFYSTASQTYR